MRHFLILVGNELLYLKWGLLLWLSGLSMLFIYNQIGQKEMTGVMPFMPLMFSSLYAMRAKEKRDRLLTLLPVSHIQAGGTRLALLLSPFILFFVLVVFYVLCLPAIRPVNLFFVLGFMDALLLVLSLFFMLHDWMTRRSHKPLTATRVIAAVTVGSVFVLGLVAYQIHGSNSALAQLMDRAVTVIMGVPVFHGPLAIIRLTVFSLAVASMTVWTYNRRMTFMESAT